MPQLTSDRFVPYIPGVTAFFGPGVDFMQTVKNYRKGGAADRGTTITATSRRWTRSSRRTPSSAHPIQ